MENIDRRVGIKRPLFYAFFVFVVFALPTVWVWFEGRRHQEVLMLRHTEDVALQAGRRLSVFVASHLRVASIFAKRWATHENGDYSKRRFEEFATVVVNELPGYEAIGLLSSDHETLWGVPDATALIGLRTSPQWRKALDSGKEGHETYLSSPLTDGDITRFYAVLPLWRDSEFLGYLVTLFRGDILMNDCFHRRIRSEFHFQVKDGEVPLFRSNSDVGYSTFENNRYASRVPIQIENRSWQLWMTPKVTPNRSRTDGLGVILLGFVLSMVMSGTTYQLVRRIELYRLTRDKAFMEIAERKKAETERNAAIARLAMLSRKAMAAEEEERMRLSVEMHDELGQLLTALRLNLEYVQKILKHKAEVGPDVLAESVELAETATNELRRICRGLRPPLLDDLGLSAAVRLLIREFEKQSGLKTTFLLPTEDVSRRPDDTVALSAYRILQESLTNIRRHANAGRIDVALDYDNFELHLKITDDGVGFDEKRNAERQGCGLDGMRERANLVGGTLSIASSEGRGTEVFFTAPLKGEEGHDSSIGG